MMRRGATGLVVALLVGWLVLSEGGPASAQMGPGMMGGGMMGQGQTAAMPMPQMAAVVRQMADRLASGKGLQTDKAERLRQLADQLAAAAGRMAGGMGPGMMGGGMMGQGSEQMNELSRILGQISDLLRDQ
ncbi:MAG: hypothetical protein HY725_16185 [Candidatus Rokubacteria bacterium]|nr:hypothetical protein [Candidatus Rokubacteria bacterium]